jgi:hypothetical protein
VRLRRRGARRRPRRRGIRADRAGHRTRVMMWRLACSACTLLLLAAAAPHAAAQAPPTEAAAPGDRVRLRLEEGVLTGVLLGVEADHVLVLPQGLTIRQSANPPSLRARAAGASSTVVVDDPLIALVQFQPGARLEVPTRLITGVEVNRGRGLASDRRPDWAFAVGFGIPLVVLVPSATLAGAVCACGVTLQMAGLGAATALVTGTLAVVLESVRRGPRWVPATL